MSGLVIAGAQYEVPGVTVLSWLDDPTLRLGFPNDGFRMPGRRLRAIVLHTTQGTWPQIVAEGTGKPTARSTIKYWERSSEHAGAHLIVDADGTVLCLADLLDEVAYHCSGLNKVSVGIEVKQSPDGTMYEAQLAAISKLVPMLCSLLEIPRRVCVEYRGVRGDLDTFSGVLGHRDASRNRGRGDPGDYVMRAVLEAGFEAV